MIDYLIIGSGLAGISFSEIALQNRKSILVLDDQKEFFLHNRLGGPFLNSNQTLYFLEGELSLGEKSKIYTSFDKQSPEVVIDRSGLFRVFLKDFPAIGGQYEEKEAGIFYLK